MGLVLSWPAPWWYSTLPWNAIPRPGVPGRRKGPPPGSDSVAFPG